MGRRIYDPSEDEAIVKEDHKKFVEDQWNYMLERTNIDEAENERLVKKYHTRVKDAQEIKDNIAWLYFKIIMLIIAILGMIGGGIACVALGIQMEHIPAFLACPPLIWGIWKCYLILRDKLFPRLEEQTLILEDLNEKVDRAKSACEKNIKPMIAETSDYKMTDAVSGVMEGIWFDSFLGRYRMDRMNQLGVPLSNNNVKESTLQTLSGDAFDNSFVIIKKRTHWMDEETVWEDHEVEYTYYKKDSDGTMVRRTGTQVLRFETDPKPYPCYGSDSKLIFASQEVVNLCFTHSFDGIDYGKKRKRNKDSKDNFTMIVNSDFEKLFGGADRTNEQQYRALFEADAQRCMVNLLESKKNYFSYSKKNAANIISIKDGEKLNLSAYMMPSDEIDLAKLKEKFLQINTVFFDGFYRFFSPLLCFEQFKKMPISRHYADEKNDGFSVYLAETMANEIGAKALIGKNTRIMVQAELKEGKPSEEVYTLHIRYYDEKTRYDRISVQANDGKWHTRDIEWTEYISRVKEVELSIIRLGLRNSVFREYETVPEFKELFENKYCYANGLFAYVDPDSLLFESPKHKYIHDLFKEEL